MGNLSLHTVALHLSRWLNPLAVMALVTSWVVYERVDSAFLLVVLWAVCAAFGIVLPLSYVLWLRHRGEITDLFIADQKKRQVPLAWTVVSYGCGAGALWGLRAPDEVLAVMVCCACLALLMLGVTPFVKISLHAVGIWGGFAMVYFWGAPGHLCIAPVAVSWARVILGAHTQAQVILGSILGVGVTWSILHVLADRVG